MDAFYIIILFMILAANVTTSFCLYRMTDKPKQEIDLDEELDLAVEKIEEYCLSQTEKTHCRFNLNDTNETCDCMLVKNPPEGWNHANNKE